MKRNNALPAVLLLLICAVLLMITLAGTARADGGPVRTSRQEALHEAADILRAYGYAEDSAVIKALQAEWLAQQEDLSIVAKVIDGEAGGCPWEHRVAVGAVVMNRVASEYFPNSVYEVVAAPMQYSWRYLTGFDNIRRGSWEAAKAAMDGDHDVPSDVYWQAEFIQGKSIWWTSEVDTGWYRSTTYFCRGIPGVS